MFPEFMPRAFEILLYHQQISLSVLIMFHVFIGLEQRKGNQSEESLYLKT